MVFTTQLRDANVPTMSPKDLLETLGLIAEGGAAIYGGGGAVAWAACKAGLIPGFSAKGVVKNQNCNPMTAPDANAPK